MKKFVLILLIMGAIFPLFSATWSATVGADAKLVGEVDNLLFDNKDRFTLRAFVPFGVKAPISITAEAYYELGVLKPLENNMEATLSHLINLSMLQFAAQFSTSESSNINVTLGRFNVYDATTIILSQPIDAVKVMFSGSTYEVSTHVGFTGFLNGHAVTLFGVENKNILSDVYTFAPAFILANVSFRLPYLFDGQHAFSVDVNGAIELSDDTSSSNRFYATLGLQGPMGESFYYNASTTLNYVFAEQNTIANLSILELSYFLPFSNSILSWKTIFATGGAQNTFVPITENLATMDDSIPYGGMLKTGLVGILSPVESLLLYFGADVLVNIMDASKNKGYSGVQWNLSSRWSMLSDVYLMANIGNFFSSESNTDPYIDASVGLSIIF